MATVKPSAFVEYELSEQEQLVGSILSYEQKLVYQNLRAGIFATKCNLDYNPTNPLDYAQQEAYLKGQLAMLNHIFDLDEAVCKQISDGQAVIKQEQSNDTIIQRDNIAGNNGNIFD